ncbi:Hypothetical_protein [Hexamita inflata]|uniref:Hypothetical_protein n=1 Tax=Hexamita inflata TaxID=28002 RepID=A0AA86TY87_9EUKA|nr:Hypothetical protein HINF_LOCUS20566 [Hexamita inflata]
MSKQIGWRINKDVEPESIEGKQWRWNENKGWISVKKVDINIKLPDKEGFEQKFVEGKGYKYIKIKVKNDDWKTDKSVKPISKLIEKDYEWNEKKGLWELKKRKTMENKEVKENKEIKENKEQKENKQQKQETVIETEDSITSLRNEILKIKEIMTQKEMKKKQIEPESSESSSDKVKEVKEVKETIQQKQEVKQEEPIQQDLTLERIYCGVRANFDFNKCLCNNCA